VTTYFLTILVIQRMSLSWHFFIYSK